MAHHTDQGRRGEHLAADFLRAQGYEVLCTNYRHGRAEIDLIVQQQDTLVFVEVKARRSAAYGHPEAALTPAQAARIVAAADAYVHETDWRGEVRFDIVAVLLRRPAPEITHFPDAFY